MKLKAVFLPVAGLIVLLMGSWSFKPERAPVARKPNIILIVSDDLGYGDVGFNGQTKIQTPNLDRMAAEGLVFRQQYAGTAVCGPSRAALLTGIHTAHATVRELSEWSLNGKPADLLPSDVTVAEELKRAGYQTGMIGKWGLDEGGTTGNALAQGFDYFYGFKTHREAHHYYPEYLWQNNEKVLLPGNDCARKIGTYSNDTFASQALTFIQKHRDGPFFLYLPFTLPHNELTVPDDSKQPYQTLGWPERPMKVAHYHHDPDGNLAYAGMVSRLDRYVGQIMAELKKQKLDENTLIMFTSDNGPGFDDGFFDSNGPFRGKKFQLYEGGIRVPFVARWPGTIKAGSVTSHACAFWDFLPTVCELAGVRPSATIDGISYLPTLLGKPKAQKRHDFFYWEINEREGPIQAVVMGAWKGIRFYEKPFELYNLRTDPGETANLADQHPEVVARLKAVMTETRTEHPEFPLTKRKARY
ncbi:arylsulfatase A-like enzyme [Larkinella arboricola]|uniref:Arylsulfatase A-like enzyme n=1 Tax=Larkinella arboricola TaxID=643671 RepID=A0A327X3J0_LARAB|nr:arylsulfatase [Larkinella arboricola]RAK00155.1 arylsulfatase A-like enzyme [Larkinella arboricola]